jgi:hypothetical protein
MPGLLAQAIKTVELTIIPNAKAVNKLSKRQKRML